MTVDVLRKAPPWACIRWGRCRTGVQIARAWPRPLATERRRISPSRRGIEAGVYTWQRLVRRQPVVEQPASAHREYELISFFLSPGQRLHVERRSRPSDAHCRSQISVSASKSGKSVRFPGVGTFLP